ncbi:hypothetical protein DFH11DRAFT_305189 [Phellopilus nigrolimitatus]|nr:hypothetical protein DFH11DRAFT_305189 [Phellopilus nigrolimitatus]
MQRPLPPTPPYTIYSPTSPVPLRIMHVPISVPMYQSLPGENRRPAPAHRGKPRGCFRRRTWSRKGLPSGMLTSDPCRFFNDFGRCHKGNHCNFMHSETPITRITPISPSPLSPRNKQWEESVVPKQKNPVVDECSQPGSPSSEKPGNFYRINWRVVGGGVKMGTDSKMP